MLLHIILALLLNNKYAKNEACILKNERVMMISVKHVLHRNLYGFIVEIINHDFGSKSLTFDIRKTIQVINLIFSGKKTTCLGCLEHLLFLC